MHTKNHKPFPWKYVEWLVHFLVWGLFFGSLNVCWGENWFDYDLPKRVASPFSVIGFLLNFYGNSHFLIPRFLKKKKWLHYALGLVTLFVIVEGTRSLILLAFAPSLTPYLSHFQIFLSHLLGGNDLLPAFAIGIVLSGGYRFTRDGILDIFRIEKLKAEKKAMELAYLKSQVNPHFLFNTLNSLYALALEEGSDKTAESITRLGSLMRYNLHDAQADSIPLDRELEYLQKYIGLQSLRATDLNEIEVDLPTLTTTLPMPKIPPMLLLPLLENAFKYGIHPIRKSRIFVQAQLDGNQFLWRVENTIVNQPSTKESSGLGITNLQSQLALLYPENHLFEIQESPEHFQVTLTLNLAP